MSTMYVKARRASAQTIPNNTRTKITGLSLNEVDPLGAPSPWNNGTQKMVATTAGVVTVSRDVRLAVDDTVEMYVRQISGATQEIAQAELTVCWIRA